MKEEPAPPSSWFRHVGELAFLAAGPKHQNNGPACVIALTLERPAGSRARFQNKPGRRHRREYIAAALSRGLQEERFIPHWNNFILKVSLKNNFNGTIKKSKIFRFNDQHVNIF